MITRPSIKIKEGDEVPNFLQWHLIKNKKYKDSLINDLCKGIGFDDDDSYIHKVKLKEMYNYVINEKYTLFDRDEFKGSLYEDEDETLSLILPAIRRVYGKIFISPPTLLSDKRLELLHLYFNIDEFIDYLIDILLKSKDSLKYFENLDRTVETLTLIVDNYIAMLVTKVRECDDHSQEIRDIKINNTLK